MKAKIVFLCAATVLFLFLSAAYGEAVLLENKYLTVTPSADGKGVTLTSKLGGTKADVVLVDAKGGVRGKLGKNKLKLPADRNFVEVSAGGHALEVRVKARFAFIPDFHGFDPLYDPTLCKENRLHVPAENFLVTVCEGGAGGVMLVWPSGGKQIPTLVAEGRGAERRFTKTRVTFGGSKVYVAVMDHPRKLFPYKNSLAEAKLDYAHEVKPRERPYKYAVVKTGWKFPYKASWYTILAKPYPLVKRLENMKNEKGEYVIAGNIKKAAPPVSGIPSETWSVRSRYKFGWSDVMNTYRFMSRSEGGEWVLNLEKRFKPYHAAVTYPRTRYLGTPKDAITVSDVLYETLGKAEAYKVVDHAGLKGRWVGIPKGEPTVDATCAGWHMLNTYFKNKQKDKFLERLQGMYNFCHYNKVRIDEFRKMARDVIAACREASKDAKLKALSTRLIHCAEHVEELWEEENKHFRKSVITSLKTKSKFRGQWFLFEGLTEAEAKKIELDDKFFKRIKDHCLASYDSYLKKGTPTHLVRPHWTDPGGTLDGIISCARRVACRIRQEAALAGVHSPEERAFALKIRGMVQKTLRNFHLKEGWPKAKMHFWLTPR